MLPRQQVQGQPIAASLHEISAEVPVDPPPARIRVTPRLTTNYSMISPQPVMGSLMADSPESEVSSAADESQPASPVHSARGTVEASGSSFSSLIEIVKKFDETPGIIYSSLALPTTSSDSRIGSSSEIRSSTRPPESLDVSQTEVLSHSEASAAPASPPPSGATQ